jgi:hypothetical protein
MARNERRICLSHGSAWCGRNRLRVVLVLVESLLPGCTSSCTGKGHFHVSRLVERIMEIGFEVRS